MRTVTQQYHMPVSPINLDDTPYELGDNVRLIQRRIGVNEDLRVTSVNYDPYNKHDITLYIC